MNARKPILVCGDAMVDEFWWGDVARISPEAPVPVVLVNRQEDRFGAADNVAANIQALGGDFLTATCNVARKIRLVARGQQVARIDFDFPPKGLDSMERTFSAALPKCDIVIFSDYGKGTLINAQRLITQAKAAGKTVLVDPKGHDFSKYKGADLLKPNTAELRELMGGWGDEGQMNAKAKLLRGSAGVEAVLLTQAGEGMTLYLDHTVCKMPSVAREIYDVTGAGDTAIAAFAVALSRDSSYPEAAHYANKAAGVVCGKFGTSVALEEEVFGPR